MFNIRKFITKFFNTNLFDYFSKNNKDKKMNLKENKKSKFNALQTQVLLLKLMWLDFCTSVRWVLDDYIVMLIKLTNISVYSKKLTHPSVFVKNKINSIINLTYNTYTNSLIKTINKLNKTLNNIISLVKINLITILNIFSIIILSVILVKYVISLKYLLYTWQLLITLSIIKIVITYTTTSDRFYWKKNTSSFKKNKNNNVVNY